MKVYMINTVLTGSTGHIMTDIYNKIVSCSGECRIAYGRGNADNRFNALKSAKKTDLIFHALKTRLFDRHGLGSVNATKKIVEDIKIFNPDIIHLHNIHGYYLNIKILFEFLKEYNKPVVWTLHDCWTFTGHCAYYGNCTNWQDGCVKCVKGANKNYPSSFKTYAAKNFKLKKELFTSLKNLTLVPVSHWLEGEVKKSFLKDQKIFTIQNGVDINQFKHEESNLRESLNLQNKYVIMCSAPRWDSERKGFHKIKETAKSAEKDCVFVLLGQNVPKKDITNNMVVLGRVKFNDLNKYYSMADVFLNASNQETFGLVTLEALACGTPVIVNDVTACAEMVNDKCAVVVKGEPEHYIDAISIARQRKFSFADCRERAEEFDKEKQLEKYYNLFENILKNVDR